VTTHRLKPQLRREQLLDAGAAMFAEKPYGDVMIQDIAAVAGVSRALMYHYFPTKRPRAAQPRPARRQSPRDHGLSRPGGGAVIIALVILEPTN
jgi:AcrR family transcriptional regulator